MSQAVTVVPVPSYPFSKTSNITWKLRIEIRSTEMVLALQPMGILATFFQV